MGRIRMNKLLLVLFCLTLLTLSLFDTSNAAGIQKLDSKTFDGALSKADIMLVKFDQNNPDPKMHAAFEKVVSELSKEIGMENMTAAHVEVIKDGEITNSELVSKYNIKKLIYDESLPVIASFTRNKEGDKYPEGETHSPSIIISKMFDVDLLRRGIRSNTGIYFTLPGCIDTFDFLAVQFAQASSAFKQGKIIPEAEVKLSQIPEAESENIAIAKEYISYMKKAVDSGKTNDELNEFIQQEIEKSAQKDGQASNQVLNILDALPSAGSFKWLKCQITTSFENNCLFFEYR